MSLGSIYQLTFCMCYIPQSMAKSPHAMNYCVFPCMQETVLYSVGEGAWSELELFYSELVNRI